MRRRRSHHHLVPRPHNLRSRIRPRPYSRVARYTTRHTPQHHHRRSSTAASSPYAPTRQPVRSGRYKHPATLRKLPMPRHRQLQCTTAITTLKPEMYPPSHPKRIRPQIRHRQHQPEQRPHHHRRPHRFLGSSRVHQRSPRNPMDDQHRRPTRPHCAPTGAETPSPVAISSSASVKPQASVSR